jgi:hypothetical protein
MAGGVVTIAGAAASTAIIPVVICAVGGAIVLGGVGWGAYKLAQKLLKKNNPVAIT